MQRFWWMAVPFILAMTGILLTRGECGHGQPPKDKYAEHIAPTGPRTPEEERKAFHLPPGFEIQLVASEPEIKKPINIAFDARGRLWVTQSEEYPFPVKAGAPSRDTVKILDDFQADGRARKITTFADNLNIPIGVLPLGNGNSALVYSIPDIWKMSDTQGAGKADKREALYEQYGFADTHGMTGEFQMGFDGWVYACHGYSNTSTVVAKDGSKITMTSGNTYRFKTDGSHIEYWTHGQVNPFGLCFDPLGNLFSCDCHTRPVMQLLRGGWYPSFARPHDGLEFAPDMMTHDHGSTAIAGITYYAAEQFPQEYRGNVFVGNVVTSRINRDRLERHGSTYKAIEMPDFIKCDDPWFRPVDIRLGPDGALYVADFYTKIIGHYEVPLTHPLRDTKHGRIWRIVYTGKGGAQLGNLEDYTKYDEKKLFTALRDPNLTVRLTATHLLAARDRDTVGRLGTALLLTSDSPLQRVHLLWVLEREGQLHDDQLADALHDKEAILRIHALRVLANRAQLTKPQHAQVIAALKDSDAFAQRCAVEALATHPAAANMTPLLAIRQSVPRDDSHLLYAVRVALRDQLKVDAVWAAIDRPLDAKDRTAIADVCLGLPTTKAADFLLHYIATIQTTPAADARFVHHVARYGTNAVVDELVTTLGKSQPARLEWQATVFKALQKGLQESARPLTPDALTLGRKIAVGLFESSSPKATQSGVELAGSLKIVELEPDLLKMLNNRQQNAELRRAAAAALVAIDGKKNTPALAAVLDNAEEPLALRGQIASTLAGINQAAALEALIKSLPTAPAKLETTIATGLAGSKQGAERLLEAVAAGKASPRLLLDPAIAAKLQQTKLPNLAERLAKLTKGLPSADASLAKLIDARRRAFLKGQPDAARGKIVFENNCAACHIIANKGAKIGPQLDGIGIRGIDRLLEDILDPSRNVDQAFRTTSLTLTDGKIVSGLFLRQDGDVLVLADDKGKEVRVPRETVDQRNTLQLSPMPANFGDQITEADMVSLLAYLLEQRVKN
jgi:putative heme-binding domain-containing protein